MNFEKKVQDICEYALRVLGHEHLRFKVMQRRGRINTRRSYVIGRTNLKTGTISIDIRTAKTRKEKKISGILRTLCHEVAHHQKKPYQQFFRGRWIIRQHYPEFYRQVKKNIEILKNDDYLGKYFAKNSLKNTPKKKKLLPKKQKFLKVFLKKIGF